MKVMHYSLGVPPIRTGGLTKYFWDFVRNSEGVKKIENIIVYPMKRFFNDNDYKKVVKKNLDMPCFEMSTDLTIPIVFGIKNPEQYYVELNNTETKKHLKFFSENHIELIHLHTLMGLTIGFFKAAKINNIKIIYTSHDYFGICPKTTLFDTKNNNCLDYKNGKECTICNYDAISDFKLFLSQSMFLKKVNKTVNTMKKNNEKTIIENKNLDLNIDRLKKAEYFKKIREFYFEIFNFYINHFHFNSSSTKEVFLEYITPTNNSVINISHENINMLKSISLNKKNITTEKTVNIVFLGPYKKQKGVHILLQALSKITTTQKWILYLYGDERKVILPFDIEQNVIVNGKYNTEELYKILKKADLVVVPSLSKETFGFTALEALAMNVPVLVHENVGAKDLIVKNMPEFIYKTQEDLQSKLESILNNREDLLSIDTRNLVKGYEDHIYEILSMYEEVLISE